MLLNVPFAFAHAMLAGMFNFIPNLGPTLSAIFPIFVALLQSRAKRSPVLILYVVIKVRPESLTRVSPMGDGRSRVSLLRAAYLIAQTLSLRPFYALRAL